MTRNVSEKAESAPAAARSAKRTGAKAPGAKATGKKAARAKATRPARRGTRGALSVVIGTFVIAGMLRLGVGVSAAVERTSAAPAAQTAGHDTGPAVHGSDRTLAMASGHASATPSAACDATAGLAMPLVTALKAREARVATREAALDDRRQALALTEKVVNAKLAELKAAEEKLSKTLAIADTAAEKDVARLTQVYAAMKPKQASAVFEQMAPDFAAGFLGKMPAASAAAILSGLTPEKAYTVSVILAGRNAGAPKH
ncbi:MotE family protein [Acidimangrovimonas sediminis]|uniref:MotE family protein n=1 Tax=Acidimangrovimonas sediminis TaxID=2056283 RepID=UPI001E5B369B|nr:hypothetical protein [Acidimangrovimonas sediminis]